MTLSLDAMASSLSSTCNLPSLTTSPFFLSFTLLPAPFQLQGFPANKFGQGHLLSSSEEIKKKITEKSNNKSPRNQSVSYFTEKFVTLRLDSEPSGRALSSSRLLPSCPPTSPNHVRAAGVVCHRHGSVPIPASPGPVRHPDAGPKGEHQGILPDVGRDDFHSWLGVHQLAELRPALPCSPPLPRPHPCLWSLVVRQPPQEQQDPRHVQLFDWICGDTAADTADTIDTADTVDTAAAVFFVEIFIISFFFLSYPIFHPVFHV